MKLTKYMGLALAMTAFASCSNEDELGAAAWENDPSAVHIQASVGHTLLARTNPGATDKSIQAAFNEGDQINVKAGTQNPVVYKLTQEKWTPTPAESFLKWKGTSMPFEAFYPTTEGTSMTTFTVPTDQHTSELIAKADYMTFAQEVARPESTGASVPVSLEMERKTARILVNVHLNDEFHGTDGIQVVNEIKIAGNRSINDNSSSDLSYFTPLLVQNPQDSNMGTFVALVAPTNKNDNELFITLSINFNQKIRKYSLPGIPEIKAGTSYTYNLYVGQRKVMIESVTIKDWNTDPIITGEITPQFAKVDEVNHSITTSEMGLITPELIQRATGASKKLTVSGPLNNDDMVIIGNATKADLPENALVTDLNLKGAKITEFGESIFQDSKMTNIILPDGIESLGDYCFQSCKELTTFTLPASLKTLGINLFTYCRKLTTVNVEEGIQITSIPYGCFDNTMITSFTIPSSVTHIEKYAFQQTPLWESFVIPATVRTIGEQIFAYTNVSFITIEGEKEDRNFSDNMFANIRPESNEPYPTLTLDATWASDITGSCTFKGYDNFLKIIRTGTPTIDKDKRIISTMECGVGKLAPSDIKDLYDAWKYVKIVGPLNGQDMKVIREATACPFIVNSQAGNCSLYLVDLSEASIQQSDDVYAQKREGYPYTIYDLKLTADNQIGAFMFSKSTADDIILPKNITSIEEGAFAFCASLKKLTIPASVTKIGNNIFYEELWMSYDNNLVTLTSLTIEAKSTATVNKNMLNGFDNATNCVLTLDDSWFAEDCPADKKAVEGQNVTWMGKTWKEVKKLSSVTPAPQP